jgi:hypothetical protein
MHREVQVRFGEERQGNSSTTPCLLLYYPPRSPVNGFTCI